MPASRREVTELELRRQRLANLLAKIEDVPTEWFSGSVSSNGKPHSKAIEPQKCSTWLECESAWKEAMQWREAMSDALAVLLAVCASTQQAGNQLFLQLVGSAGCLRGNTPIYDPIKGTNITVEERYRRAESFHVWSRSSDGNIDVRYACAPCRYTEEPMYRVYFNSGNWIDVTANHRFWNGDSYVELRTIVDALQLFGSYRLPSISELDLSVPLRDVHHYSQTTGGSQLNYSAYSYLYGGLPLPVASTYRGVLPLLIGALVHNLQSLREDASGCGYIHNHPYLSTVLLSMLGYHCPALIPDVFLELLRLGVDTLRQYRPYTSTDEHTRQQKALTDTVQQLLVAFRHSTLLNVILLTRLLGCMRTLLQLTPAQSEQQLLLSTPQCRVQQFEPLYRHSIALACYPPDKSDTPLIESKLDDIVKVELIGTDVYYDFHVPVTNNYWACGVFNHNSGKTTLCEGLLVSRHCHHLEHLTGFHSGWKGETTEEGNHKDCSLIARINGKTLITPEADIMMSSPRFSEIMSQQRRIFDGKSGATYKNSSLDTLHVGLRTPWIMAGTPALMDTDQSRLGDRFLRVIISDPEESEKRAILRSALKSERVAMLGQGNGTAGSIIDPRTRKAHALTGGYVDWLRANVEEQLPMVEVSPEAEEKCIDLAELSADLRARPNEDKRKKESHDCKELPTRLARQNIRLAAHLAVVFNKKEIDSDILRILRKVALDTAHGHSLNIVQWLCTINPRILSKTITYQMCGGLSSKILESWLNMREDRASNYLNFLRKIDVLELRKPTGTSGLWALTSRVQDLYQRVMGD